MMRYILVMLFLAVPFAAQAAVTVVSPVIIPLPLGSAVHKTPTDQNSQPIPIQQCTVVNIPTAIVILSKDATGIIMTSVAAGSTAIARWDCTDGITHVLSATFTVTVPNPPYTVTAVGDTMP